MLRSPLNYDLQKQGLASRSECANLGAGGRPFARRVRATRRLGRTLWREGRGGLDQLVQGSGDGLIPAGHHMLVAQRDLGRGVAHALHQLAGVRPGRQRQGGGRVVEVMEPQPLDTSRAGCSKPPAAAEVTAAQVAALADAIGPRYRALVLVAAYGGLRWGELVGLRVKRVTCSTDG